MELQEITNKLNSITKGQYTNVCYKTTKIINGVECEKTTHTIVRFVEYSHIKGVEVKGKSNPNEQYHNGLIYNEHTNKWYIQMAVVNNPNFKAKVEYKVNGQVVSKEQYQEVDKPKPNKTEMIVFRKCIDDIISLG